jgi:hypothetical protein
MTGQSWLAHTRRAMVLVTALLLTAAAAFGQGTLRDYRGLRLADALRALQGAGLRIVFTSRTVTPELRVASEPRASSPRQQLDELLAPHGLKAEEGPGGILQVVRAAPASKDAGGGGAATKAPRRSDESSGGAASGESRGSVHSEHVTVIAARPNQHDRGVVAEMSLDADELARVGGDLADHPMRTVHALPGVSAIDDFRSEFVVRGSPARHLEVVVDGVSTPWLRHIAPRGGAASLAMLTGQVLEEATLRAGAHPRRYGDRLGAQLELTLREGSRERVHLRGSVGGINATVTAEGPLGRSARGSWLVAARQSYLDWPTGRDGDRNAFGFADAVARVVFDARRDQQVSFTILDGTSNTDEEEDNLGHEDRGGTNRTSMVNLAWRSTFGSSAVLRQRAYVVMHRFLSTPESDRAQVRGFDEELGYRADFVRPVIGGLLEAGVQVGRLATRYDPGVAGVGWQRSGYAHFRWSATPALTVSPGVRITDSTFIPHRTVTRWILGEYAFKPGWSMKASAGVSRQLPDFRQVLAAAPLPGLRSERATHVDLALERRMSSSIRWQATVFNRQESDILRDPDLHPRLAGDALVEPSDPGDVNSLHGSSRGLELLVARWSATGVSGWVAYSYGRARHADAALREAFWADFDQRHTLSVFGVYRISRRTGVGMTYRAGTNFPIPGYLREDDGHLFVSDRRNQVRLPLYARLDIRAERRFEYFGGRMTLFGEILNVSNHTNVGLADGLIRRSTGEAFGFTRTLFPRRPSAGVIIEF